MQCIGIKGDLSHPVAVNTAGNLIGTSDRKTAAVGRARVHRQRCEWRQRSSPEKRNKLAPSHAILSLTRFAGAKCIGFYPWLPPCAFMAAGSVAERKDSHPEYEL